MGETLTGISLLAYFLTGFAIFSYSCAKLDSKLVLGLAVLATIGLYLLGPNPFLFGMILATGWYLLNMGVEKFFPIID
ncbi:MAG: hypothetical protein CL971_00515 [Euryarchaeota archaeon]|nr:hypothetical protein [Euryarchaeota archaeon]